MDPTTLAELQAQTEVLTTVSNQLANLLVLTTATTLGIGLLWGTATFQILLARKKDEDL